MFFVKAGAALAVSLLFSSAAYAADTVAHEADDLSVNWTGGYVGVHAGYGWGTVLDVNNPNATEQDIDGGFGGIQAGYNHQFSNNVVLGVEADVSLGNVSGAFDGRTISVYNGYYTEDEITALGTLRARLGYSAGRFLPFVTGGLAWANVDHMLGCDRARVVGAPLPPTGCATKFETSKSDIAVGWTVGAGAEYALTDKWSLKGEYLYTDLGKNRVMLVDANFPGNPVNNRNFDMQFSAVKLGLNYRF